MPEREASYYRLIGFSVLLISLFLFMRAKRHYAKAQGREHYSVAVEFNHVDGLSETAEIRLSGIKVGNVESMVLTEQNKVKVKMRIAKAYRLPDDTSAMIQTQGIMGAKFVELIPGMSEDDVEDGGSFLGATQDSIILLDILNTASAVFKEKIFGKADN